MAGETSALASYVVGTDFQKLPPEVVAKAKVNILDTFGVLLADSRLKMGEKIIESVRDWGGKPESSVVGTDIKTSCTNAALANGVFGHGDEMDDNHNATTSHPGAVMVPAALAVAEKEHSNGEQFINAVVLGYDVGCRMILALGVMDLRLHNYHPTCIGGCFGATAAAARLLSLDHEQTVYALALAGSQASGVLGWMTEAEHMSKSFQTGIAARNGVTAALLAKLGYEGPRQVLEGRLNIFEAYSQHRNYGVVLQELGTRYEIMRANLKKYSAGHPIHAPLDAMLHIIMRQGLRAHDIAEIAVRMAPQAAEIVDSRDTPSINLFNILAIAVYQHKMEMEQSHSEELARDRAVLAMRKRIKLVKDAELGQVFPDKTPCEVTITTKSGKRFSESREHAPGELQNPLTQDEVEAKFKSLATPVVGEIKARRLISMVNDLEHVANMREIGDFLRV